MIGAEILQKFKVQLNINKGMTLNISLSVNKYQWFNQLKALYYYNQTKINRFSFHL